MIEIKPLKRCNAVVEIPGSKSYTHRALIVAALAEGESILVNALRSEDTEYTARGLGALGIPIFWKGDLINVWGGGGKLIEEETSIYTGDSGTSMRFLTAVAAIKKGRTVLDGSQRLRERPMAALLEGLVSLGARAYSLNQEGYPPVIVESDGLSGGMARVKGRESSQFISALLMVAPLAKEDVRVEVVGPLASRPYVEVTCDVMSSFGAKVEQEGDLSFFIRAGQHYFPRQYRVEGDASNASYFLAAAAVTGGRVKVQNFNPASFQGDAQFLGILKKMGCRVTRGENFAEVIGQELSGIEADMNTMPDLVPTLAVMGAFARGETLIRNVGHLHFKESDRLKTVAEELGRMGVRVEEGADYLKITGGGAKGAEIETHNDHRLAMSFAVAGLAVHGIKIKGENCVHKSFPEFWETLQKLY